MSSPPCPGPLPPDCSALLTSFFHVYFAFCHVGLSQLCSPRRAFSEQGPLRLIRSASFFAGLQCAVCCVVSLAGVTALGWVCSSALEIRFLTFFPYKHKVRSAVCSPTFGLLALNPPRTASILIVLFGVGCVALKTGLYWN